MRLTRELRRLSLRGGLLLLVACSAAPSHQNQGGSGEPVGRTAEGIVNGTVSPTAQNFAVLVQHKVGCNTIGCTYDECTGTLVAPNLVLTARHCVSNTADKAFTCDATGKGSSGGSILADFPAPTISIFAGTSRPLESATPSAVGAQLFHDGATNLCDHDLALVGLSQPIAGVPTATLRFETPSSGGFITAVGWGATTTANAPATRQQRSNIPIANVGPFMASNGEDVAPNEFDVGESICQGDSGSPALDGTGAVIGVASRGGNNLVPNPNDLGASCVGNQSYNSYSQVAAFRTVIDQAMSAMGDKAQVATGGLLGDSCAGPTDCSSGVCAGSGSPGYCSERCNSSQSSSCPSGYSCSSVNGQDVCQQGGGSCSIGRPAGRSGLWIVVMGLALAGRIRRRRRARLTA